VLEESVMKWLAASQSVQAGTNVSQLELEQPLLRAGQTGIVWHVLFAAR
jgi:hypothetical protein